MRTIEDVLSTSLGRPRFDAWEVHIELTVEIQEGGLFERISAQSSWEDRTAYDDAKKAFESASAADKEKAKKTMDDAYQSLYNKQEWWHFQWAADKQKHFIDELELIGFTEPEVRKVKDKAGVLKWPDDADLDHAPG